MNTFVDRILALPQAIIASNLFQSVKHKCFLFFFKWNSIITEHFEETRRSIFGAKYKGKTGFLIF